MEINLKEVTYKNIFSNLSLNINDREITGIIGKNGSGKTCLLDLIYGVDANFDGRIYIGKNIINGKKNTQQFIINNIAYLRQNYDEDLFFDNILDDINYDIDRFDSLKLNDLLKLFDLSQEIIKKNYSDLSSTEVKKMLLVKTLLKSTRIILLDDPTNGLDDKSISSLIKLLKREKRGEKIILVSSTDSDFLLKLCDKIIVLDKKNTYESVNKYDIFTNKQVLNKMYIKTPHVVDFKLITGDRKKIKLMYRDNINDLIKDIYRNVEKG